MQFQVMEEFGPGHDAMARKIKDRLALAARKARERAKAHRTALASTDDAARPKRVVFQTPHGPAYMVEREIGYGLRTGNGSPTTKITLPYVTMLDR